MGFEKLKFGLYDDQSQSCFLQLLIQLLVDWRSQKRFGLVSLQIGTQLHIFHNKLDLD